MAKVSNLVISVDETVLKQLLDKIGDLESRLQNVQLQLVTVQSYIDTQLVNKYQKNIPDVYTQAVIVND